MKKSDQLKQSIGNNAKESMGVNAHAVVLHEVDSSIDPKSEGMVRARDGAMIQIDRIIRDEEQPRVEFDEDGIARLAKSLISHGQIQPIRVRWDEDLKFYVVIAGERRLRAAKIAGFKSLHCVIDNNSKAQDTIFEQQLFENCLREDLKPIEQAKAFKRLMDTQGLSYPKLAEKLNLDQMVVHRAVSLLRLDVEIQEKVENGVIATTTASEIAKLHDPEDQQEMAHEVIRERLTRKDAAARVKARLGRKPPSGFSFTTTDGLRIAAPASMSPERLIEALEAALNQARGRADAA